MGRKDELPTPSKKDRAAFERALMELEQERQAHKNLEKLHEIREKESQKTDPHWLRKYLSKTTLIYGLFISGCALALFGNIPLAIALLIAVVVLVTVWNANGG